MPLEGALNETVARQLISFFQVAGGYLIQATRKVMMSSGGKAPIRAWKTLWSLRDRALEARDVGNRNVTRPLGVAIHNPLE